MRDGGLEDEQGEGLLHDLQDFSAESEPEPEPEPELEQDD